MWTRRRMGALRRIYSSQTMLMVRFFRHSAAKPSSGVLSSFRAIETAKMSAYPRFDKVANLYSLVNLGLEDV